MSWGSENRRDPPYKRPKRETEGKKKNLRQSERFHPENIRYAKGDRRTTPILLCKDFHNPPNCRKYDDPATLQAVSRIRYLRPVKEDYSHTWVRIPAHSSNILAVTPTCVEEGNVVTGIVTATYGTHLAAPFNTWQNYSLMDWKNETRVHIKSENPKRAEIPPTDPKISITPSNFLKVQISTQKGRPCRVLREQHTRSDKEIFGDVDE